MNGCVFVGTHTLGPWDDFLPEQGGLHILFDTPTDETAASHAAAVVPMTPGDSESHAVGALSKGTK